MAGNILNEFPTNHQSRFNKVFIQTEVAILKADTLLQAALNNELGEESPQHIHNYLWVVCDLISEARLGLEYLDRNK